MRVSQSAVQPRLSPARPQLSLRFVQKLLGVMQSRAALRKLDDHMLRDIGLTRSEAEAEAQRPLWDVPETWRR